MVFHDERPYLEFARRFASGVSVYTWGFYSKAENWLVLFDFRNVPLIEKGAGRKNVTTLAHEGTHQLTFNTGLLNRRGDAPRAVVEGLAVYSETRSLHGPAVPGQINGTRLDDLAHIQRREKWISATDLLTDDAATFGNTLDQTLLGLCPGMAPGLLPDEDSRSVATISGLLEDDLQTHRQEPPVRRRGKAFRRSRSTGSRPAPRGDPAPAREAAVIDVCARHRGRATMSTRKSTIDPVFSDAERDELGHLGYLDARLDELRERGLIAPDAYATVAAESQDRRQAIELSGRYRSAILQARKLAKKDPHDALEWAERRGSRIPCGTRPGT